METPKTIGVLKLNTNFPRLPGDIGNPDSFRYPVCYCTIDAAVPANITIADSLSLQLQEEFSKGCKKLADKNVSLITTTCGFLSSIQSQLASVSETPVICSSLALLPMLAPIHGDAKHLGVLTFNSEALNSKHLSNVTPGAIEGLLPTDTLHQVISQDLPELNYNAVQQEVIAASNRLLGKLPTARAIVLECTNLSPYKNQIRQHTGLPVYDIVDAIHWLLESQPL